MAVLVKSQIKKIAQHNGVALNVSSEFLAMFEEKVVLLLKESCRRAHDNDRRTVLPKDI